MNIQLTPRRQAALAAGLSGTLALAMSVNGTLSAFSAAITNSSNTAASGYIKMTETLLDSSNNPTTTVCNSSDSGGSSATCSSIDKYGGTATALTPGASNTTRITLKNAGNLAATAFTLTPGACTSSVASGAAGGGATTPCSKFMVTVKVGTAANPSTVLVNNVAANALAASYDIRAALGANVAPGATVYVTITLTLDSSADASYAGYQISQPLTWTFTA